MAKGDFTKAKEISEKTKLAVLERQNYKSISGVSMAGKEVEFHHVIPRSASGVGYEWNIVALLKSEHRELTDHNDITVNGKSYYTYEEFTTLIKNHLKLRYCNWAESKCKYHKGWELKDYEISRCNKKSFYSI